MKTVIVFLLLLGIIITPASAHKVIVLNESNYVQYKTDYDGIPEVKSGEWILIRTTEAESFDTITGGAQYFPGDGTFVNPAIFTPTEIQQLKSNYTTVMNRMDTIRNDANMTDTEQQQYLRDIAGAIQLAYRFLKFIFSSQLS